MANVTTICDSFKDELLQGIHAMTTDTFKCALYYSAAAFSTVTTPTAYSATNEASATNYPAGGVTLTSAALSSAVANAHVASIDWADAVFGGSATPLTLTGVLYALIYNSSKANRAVMFVTYDAARSCASSTFTVTIPETNSGTGALRIS